MVLRAWSLPRIVVGLAALAAFVCADGPTVAIISPQQGEHVTTASLHINLTLTNFTLGQDGEICVSVYFIDHQVETEMCVADEPYTNVHARIPGNIELTARLVDTKMTPVYIAPPVKISRTPGLRVVWLAPEVSDVILGNSVRFTLAAEGLAREAEVIYCLFNEDTKDIAVCSKNKSFDWQIGPGEYRFLPVLRDNEMNVIPSESTSMTFRVLGGNDGECNPGSGLLCIHGRCDGQRCVCHAGWTGRYCSQKPLPENELNHLPVTLDGQLRKCSTLMDHYLDFVRNTIYEIPRPRLQEISSSLELQNSMYPSTSMSMLSAPVMISLQAATMQMMEDGIEGDLMETGVWQGGASILMAAVVRAYGESAVRRIWVCDSFDGVPPPDEVNFPLDRGDSLHNLAGLKIRLDHVVMNFEKMGLLDENIEFVRGWFKDTMKWPRVQQIEKLAILRLDGDLYQSTWEVLEDMYKKLSVGGYCIIDDWGLNRSQAKLATIAFRTKCGIVEPLLFVGPSALWRKERITEECG